MEMSPWRRRTNNKWKQTVLVKNWPRIFDFRNILSQGCLDLHYPKPNPNPTRNPDFEPLTHPKSKSAFRQALLRTHNLHTQSNLKYVRAIWRSVQLSIISFMFFSNIYIFTGVFKFHAMKQWLPLFIYMFTLCVTTKLYLKPKQKFILI